MAIIRCTDRDPICSLSRDRFLWSACLPTSLSLDDPPHEHPPTHTFPAAQDEAPSDAAHVSTRGGSGGRVEFVKAHGPRGRSVTGYGLGGRKVSAGDMGARSMPSLRWADTGPVAWRPPRCRGAVVLRCTPPGGRAVLGEVCGRFKSAFARFRHAAPRNQHPRSRVSSRRLREIDPRFGGSSAAVPDEYGIASQYVVLITHLVVITLTAFLRAAASCSS